MRHGWRWDSRALWLVVAALWLVTTGASGTARAAAAGTANRNAAKRKAAPSDGSRVLVRVGGEGITAAMVQARIDQLPEAARATYATPDGRQKLLERMVEEKIWLDIAIKRGVADRPKVKEQLEQQRRETLIRTYLNEAMAGNPAPTDSEATAYYNAHLAEYKIPATVTVRHIQCATEADARRMKGWARGNQDFAKLAQKYSTDSLTRANGGLIGAVTRDGAFSSIGTQPALAESAFALGVGKIGGPYKTGKGWSVFKVDAIRPESVNPFEQMRPMIMRQMSSQRAQDYYQGLLEQARKDVGVQPDSTAIRSFVSMRKGAREMFREAQEMQGAGERIAAYRRLLQAYPDSEVSAQSQFMVGFIYSEELKNYDEAEKAFREVLRRYPKSELAASAQWMVDHMRTEEAPDFVTQGADSLAGKSAPHLATPPGSRKGATGKP